MKNITANILLFPFIPSGLFSPFLFVVLGHKFIEWSHFFFFWLLCRVINLLNWSSPFICCWFATPSVVPEPTTANLHEGTPKWFWFCGQIIFLCLCWIVYPSIAAKLSGWLSFFQSSPCPFIGMANHSSLSNMMNKYALFRQQIDILKKTLNEEFGSVFDEEFPAGAATAIKQPERFTAAAAGAAAAIKLEMQLCRSWGQWSWASQERNMQELTFWRRPLATRHHNYSGWSCSRSNLPQIKSLPLFHQKNYQSIVGCEHTGLFVKTWEIVMKEKKKPAYDSKVIPKVCTFFLLLLLVQKLKEKLSNNTHLIACCLSGPSQKMHLSKNHHSIASLIQFH